MLQPSLFQNGYFSILLIYGKIGLSTRKKWFVHITNSSVFHTISSVLIILSFRNKCHKTAILQGLWLPK